MISKQLFKAFVGVVALSIGQTIAQQPVSFCTLTPGDDAMPLNLTEGILEQIQTIRLGWASNNNNTCDGETILAPSTMHWHVYSLPDDDNVIPRIAMYPPDLVQPEVVMGNTLQFRLRSLETAYAKNDPIQVGVALWLPAASMTSFHLEHLIGPIVSIYYNGTEPLRVDSAGIENKVYIESVRAPVLYEASGFETSAMILATGAGGSRIEMSGIQSYLEIAVPSNTTTNDDLLQVTMSGIDSKARIVGDYGSVSMSGLESEVIVNTGCGGVVSSGLGASCSVVTDLSITEDDLTLTCFADTHIAKIHRYVCFDDWRGAIIGAVVGTLVGMCLCVGGAIACCCWCSRRGRRGAKARTLEGSNEVLLGVEAAKPLPAFVGRVVDPEAPAYATALATVIPVDPHLITAKTGTETEKGDVNGAYL